MAHKGPFVFILTAAFVLAGARAQATHGADESMVISESPTPPSQRSVTGFNGLCGSLPAAPAVLPASALSGRTSGEAHELVLDSFKAIKAYQVSLAGFRACLQRNVLEYKTVLAAAKGRQDATRTADVKHWIDELTAEYDRTIDRETEVVTVYMDVHNAYCRMGEGLKGCPSARPRND